MLVSIIAAMDPGGVIGCGGALPWHLPEDLARFRRLTMGKPIVMGRRTYESIGRPLPGRRTVVISRTVDEAPGIECSCSLDDALALLAQAPEVMICGGRGVYEAALPRSGRMYLTHLEERFAGDVRFPEVDWRAWRPVREEVVAGPVHPHRNVVYERRGDAAVTRGGR